MSAVFKTFVAVDPGTLAALISKYKKAILVEAADPYQCGDIVRLVSKGNTVDCFRAVTWVDLTFDGNFKLLSLRPLTKVEKESIK